MRIGEVLALHPKDLDLEHGTARIQHGKGDKFRVVGLDAGTSRWSAAGSMLDELGVSNRAPLICTLDGGAIRQDYVRHLLPRLAARAGIEKRVHAHGLRHAFAVELAAREGLSLSSIGTLLGHASAATTAIYLRRHGADAAIDFARAREWSP